MKHSIIKTTSATKPQNKSQQAYENLIRSIEKQKLFIKNIETGLETAHTKIETVLRPLLQEQDGLMREYLIRLDELADEIGVGKVNREWFEDYMQEELDSLLETLGFQDEKIVALFEKYTGSSVDDIINSEENQEIAKALSEFLGFEVDMKEVLEKGESQFLASHQEEILKNLRDKIDTENDDRKTTSTKKKTASQIARENRIAEENKLLAKDARSIYMRLIKKMHPDLELDPHLKASKTEIVKNVTEAYQNNDFFSLLKLQIEHLEEGESDAAALADDMLKRYNKILKRQLDELQTWIRDTHYAHNSIIEDFLDKNGKFSPQKFNTELRNLQQHLVKVESELELSYKKPKTWFKETLKIIKGDQQNHRMEDLFFNMFENMKF